MFHLPALSARSPEEDDAPMGCSEVPGEWLIAKIAGCERMGHHHLLRVMAIMLRPCCEQSGPSSTAVSAKPSREVQGESRRCRAEATLSQPAGIRMLHV